MAKKLPIRPVISKKPHKNVYDYWDSDHRLWVKCAGFEIRLWDSVTQTPIKRRIKADFETTKLACKEMLQIQQDNTIPLPTYVKRQEVQSLSELLQRYQRAKSELSLRNRQPRSPLTIERTRAAVNAFNKTMGGETRLDRITPARIELYIKRRKDTDHSEGGINTDLRTLKALFSWGVKRDYLDANPFTKVDMFRTERGKPRPLSPDELKKLFETCPPGSRWYPLVMVYILTGARVSEVLKPKLSWRDIDFTARTLTLPIRKGNRSTDFELDNVLWDLFRGLKDNPFTKAHDNKPDDRDYPFPFSASYISRKMKSIFKLADINATAHDLRDSFVSHLIYLGYPIEDVSKLAGHSSVKVTERYYYRQMDERKREMQTKLGSHVIKSLPKSAD